MVRLGAGGWAFGAAENHWLTRMRIFKVADFTEVVFESAAYGLSGTDTSFGFLQCRARGVKISPLVSAHPPRNTPVATPRPRHRHFVNLPILTRIYPSVDGGVPPRIPPVRGESTARNWRRNCRAAHRANG